MEIENNRVTCLDWMKDKEEWDKLVSEDKPEGKYTIVVSVTLFNKLHNLVNDTVECISKELCKLVDGQFEEWLSEHTKETN